VETTSSFRIVHLTSVHPITDIRIFQKECLTLAQHGYTVTLIAPHSSSANLEGVKLVPVEVPKNRIQRMFWCTWKIFRRALKENAHLYHFHDPELIPVGIALKLFKKKVVYDVHENVPASILSKEYIPIFFRKAVSIVVAWVEFVGARFFDLIVAATPAIENRFPRHKCVTVHNYPKIHRPPKEVKVKKDSMNTLIYIGSISKARGLFEMLESTERVAETKTIRLDLVGRFETNALFEKASKHSAWPLVKFYGWQSAVETVSLTQRAAIGLLIFHPEPNHIEALPNKLFEYMAAGIPVVASNFPIWREIIEPAACGILVDPLKSDQISEAILWLLKNKTQALEMGRRGAKAAYSIYNWKTESQILIDAYQRILPNRKLAA